MSNLYGNQMIPSDISSLYFYDKTYDTGVDLDDKAKNDGVFIGRYILVKGDGDNKTHSKAYRKVIKNGVMAYDEVAVLDAATTSFNTTSANFGNDYLDSSKVLESVSNVSDNTISVTNSGVYNDETGTYDVDLKINLPGMGEAVGQVYNVLYGKTNRATSLGINLSDINVSGATIEDDGLVGVLNKVDWGHMDDVSSALWANTYLNLTKAPTSNIAGDYLSLDGGTMRGSIELPDNAITDGASDLSFEQDEKSGLNYINITTNLQVANDIMCSTSASMSNTTVPNYEKVERVVNNDGKAYVLESGDYSVDSNGTVTLTNTSYTNKPAGTIFFIPVSS